MASKPSEHPKEPSLGSMQKPMPTKESSRKSFIRSLRPLRYLSSAFALWPFAGSTIGRNDRPPSRWRISHSLLVLVCYSVFHLYINYTDAYSAAPESKGREVNFVSIVIDMYNRYSGLVLFWVLHIMDLTTRPIVMDVLSGVLLVDEQFAQRLSVTPDHMRWCRFICLHVAFMFLAIGVSEWYNCIMYLSDFQPASEYCIFQCYITMLTSCTVEIQYTALVQAVKSRLQLLNELLVELNAYGADQEQTYYERFLISDNCPPIIQSEEWRASVKSTPTDFLRGIVARSSAVVGTKNNTNLSTRRMPAHGRTGASISHRGDRRWHPIKRLQHKIITVNQAPPSRPPPKPGTNKNDDDAAAAATQFPLLVASLINSQSRTCEHISMKIINDIKNVYSHLHLLSLNINKAYGAQLIFILMTLFVTLTTLLYFCTMKLFRMLWIGQRASNDDLITALWEILSTLSWACISTFRILRLCNVCNSAENEAQKIGSLIHGLGWQSNCRTTKAMVRMLSLQLRQQRIEFTAGGLFAIDHGLMFNIVGSLVTYLLILIQFDIAQNGAKWKSDPPQPGQPATERP